MNNRFAFRVGALGLAALIHAPTLAAQGTYPTQPPAPMPLKPAALPPFQETTLANGVRVVLVENHRNPTIAYRLALPAGDAYDPKGKTGTATKSAANSNMNIVDAFWLQESPARSVMMTL